jgi:hypothetical protein
MTALLLALASAIQPPCAGRVAPRISAASAAFMAATPCPGGPDKGSTRKCKGYVVVHVCPLVCCGLDAPLNMQWLTEAQAKKKDGTARSCSDKACGAGTSPAKQKGADPEPPPRSKR